MKNKKSIADELENRKVPICIMCKENPRRMGIKTCSEECSIMYYKKFYRIENKENNRIYQKEYRKRPGVKEKMKEYNKKPYIIKRTKIYHDKYFKALSLLRNNHLKEFREIFKNLK